MKTTKEIFKQVMGHDVLSDDFERGSFTWVDIESMMIKYAEQFQESTSLLPYDVLVTIGEACMFMQAYKGTCTIEGEWSDYDEILLKKLIDILMEDK